MSCPLCVAKGPNEIWRNDRFYIIDAKDPLFPCFLRVVSCRHIAEMSQLTPEERTELWDILNTIETELLDRLHPTKLNLAQFGNMVPHLHWHIIARWADDSHFPECPWGLQQRSMPTKLFNERKIKSEDAFKHLANLLTKKFG